MTQQSPVPFAFENHLVRVVEREGAPWFVGVDVCACLDLAKPENALSSLDEDERYTLTEGVSNGRDGPKARVVISEPGVYRLTFRSRKPEAERFKRWLAHEVLPALRKTGRYEAVPSHSMGVPASDPDVPGNHLWKLYLIREARQLFGNDRARSLWVKLGLPAVPPPPPTARDEAMMCLRHLLDAAVHEGGPSIRSCAERALEDDEEARALLLPAGIRAYPDRDCFAIANGRSARLAEIFRGTSWAGCHGRVLRRLPGVEASHMFRFGSLQARGNLVPAHLLDDDAPEGVARRVLLS